MYIILFLDEMDILHHDFIPLNNKDDLIDDSSDEGLTPKPSYQSQKIDGIANKKIVTTSSGEQQPISTQILKTTSGQFVILQPNQVFSFVLQCEFNIFHINVFH